MKIRYPIKLHKIFEKLKKNNIKPVIIGGYVRDFLLNIDSKDIDIELYGAKNYEQLLTLLQEFGKTTAVGKSFGVVKLFLDDIEIDFSFPRTENKTAQGHRGFEVRVDPNLDFTTASKRRDFTINAIGYDVVEQKIIDPFDGVKDLENKILRVVDPQTFVEDPLRVFRAVQFCARFELKVDEELLMLCREIVQSKEIETLAKERIFEEMHKLLLKAKRPSLGFSMIKNIGLLAYFTPLTQLTTSAYEKLISLLDNVSYTTKQNNPKVALSTLLALLAHPFEPITQQELLECFTNDKKTIHSALTLHAYIRKPTYALAMKLDREVLQLYLEVFGVKNVNYIANQTYPKIMGKDLIVRGLQPSAEFSEILERHYAKQIEPILKHLTFYAHSQVFAD